MSDTTPSQARQLLDRSRDALLEALEAETPNRRYAVAFEAARIAASTLVDVRVRDWNWLHEWDHLRRVAPDLSSWVDRFEAVRPRSHWAAIAVATEGDLVTQAEADTLLRDAEAFHHVVEASLALPYRNVLPGTLPDVTEE